MTISPPSLPIAWTTYRPVAGPEADFADLLAHGIGLVSWKADTAAEAAEALALCRRTGMKIHIDIPEVTERTNLIREVGCEVRDALLIGGVCRGKAVDRHLFAFDTGPQEVVVEPPVYNQGFAYTMGSGSTGPAAAAEPIAHYFPDIGDPVKAEIVVPLKAFDGRQHLKIIPATVERDDSATPEHDSAAGLPDASEIRTRRLYRLRFDLSGLEGALLDQVGIAVWWPYGGTEKYWILGRGNATAWADETIEATRRLTRRALQPWTDANGGTFPSDVVVAARFGDECFYITSHLNGPAVSYPLWDYSDEFRQAFAARAGADVAIPRTWGFPEIYGPDAYAWQMYTLHEGCAALCAVIRDEIARLAPGLLLFRNTTRMGIFDLINDHDGSGQELLTRNLDLVHLDPYPVSASGYTDCIGRDMSYCAGLARRYAKPLVPWMQAHTYGAGKTRLEHVTPEQVDRMAAEQYAQGVDAVMWLGYSPTQTFPATRPDSYERAAAFHRRLREAPSPRPTVRLAVVRPYRVWAQTALVDGLIRNGADWLLQQLLEVWAVRHGQAYDVFEVPPDQPLDDDDLLAALAGYDFAVSTAPCGDAWVIGAGAPAALDPADASAIQDDFERQLRGRGWLKA